jgi:hypothetical protein
MLSDLDLLTLAFLCEIGGTIDSGTALELCRTLKEERARNEALVAQLSELHTKFMELSAKQEEIAAKVFGWK